MPLAYLFLGSRGRDGSILLRKLSRTLTASTGGHFQIAKAQNGGV
jgi:hypothetical protein